MIDDVAAILESVYRTQERLLAKIDKLERQMGDTGAAEVPVPGSWGFCSPTSPPTKRIQLRHAFAWSYYSEAMWGRSWPDMTPSPSISAFDAADARYYRLIVPCMNLDWDYYDQFFIWESAYDWPTFDECAADLAEQYANWDVEPQDDTWGDGAPIIPLCAIAIRNNGTTGAVDEYEVITLNDRDKSSFIMRDLRPWLQAFYTDLW
jgi:hypothetical protein